MRLARLALVAIGMALWLAGARAEVAVPPLAARVTDLTGTLTAGQRNALENDLQALEGRSGSQLAVLLVPTTHPETIEQYSIRVVDAWKLGRKGKDDGVLLLVAKDDRKVRIDVGYGLEGTIPDVVAKRIIEETITPRFKQGDFAGGLAAGVQRLTALVEGDQGQAGEADAEPFREVPLDARNLGERVLDTVSDGPLWLLVALAAVGSILRRLLGPLFGALVMGGLAGGGAWLLTGSLGITAVAGFVGFIFVLVGVANWLSMGGGSISGGRGGSGGFSGGGGGFGGGGASGSW